MTDHEHVKECVSGRIDRRTLVQRLTALGVSTGAAALYAQGAPVSVLDTALDGTVRQVVPQPGPSVNRVEGELAAAAEVRARKSAAQAPDPAADLLVEDFGARAYPPGTLYADMVDSAAALNQTVAAAKAEGTVAVARGRFRVDSTVTIDCDADFSTATFVCDDDGIAPLVRIGTVSRDQADQVSRVTVYAPHCEQTRKALVGWGGTSVGVELCNLYRSRVFLGRVRNFTTGLRLTTTGDNGVAYNEIHGGHLDNNRVNCHLSPSSSTGLGWTNENTFYGVSHSHDTGEGSASAGTRHILLSTIPGSQPNNNLWVRASLESPLSPSVVEYMVESVGGVFNRWLQCRWEASTPRVWWNQYDDTFGSRENLIDGGYNASSISFTVGASASRNDLLSSAVSTFHGGSAAALRLGNEFSSSSPVLQVFDSATDLLTVGPLDWLIEIAATHMRTKSKANPAERWRLTPGDGLMEWGDGTSQVDTSLGRIGASRLAIGADNSLRLGAVASLPAASASRRGDLIRVEGGAGVADALYLCRKKADETYEWVAI